ncbi:hypothetical protein BGY98DRAFT_952670 [Russula aff. rugulosa BPL654]|nr:hypothetical protein BGY98DRAFT_952670 [Russula aff. rugulosa BPL654]
MLSFISVSIYLYLIFLCPFILYPALPDPLLSTFVADRVYNHTRRAHGPGLRPGVCAI